MGGRHVLVLLGVLAASGIARAGKVASDEPRAEVLADPGPAWVESLGAPGFVLAVQSPLFADRARTDTSDSVRGRALLLGYTLERAHAQVQLRAGYRYGLPFDEPLLPSDDGLILTSGGSLAVSAGTVAWLQVDLDAFRELAGARVMRFDAVPGLRFRLPDQSPFEVGVGCLASLRTTSAEGFGFERLAGLVKFSGRF